MHIFVPHDNRPFVTLGFDNGYTAMPWSEKGFTFEGPLSVSVQGQELLILAGGYMSSSVTLTRDSGGMFDAFAFDVGSVPPYLSIYFAEVRSDLGGYALFLRGKKSIVLQGQGWDGITSLTITAYGDPDYSSVLPLDDFEVRRVGY